VVVASVAVTAVVLVPVVASVVGLVAVSVAVAVVACVAEFEAEPASLSVALALADSVGVPVPCVVASPVTIVAPLCESLALARVPSSPQPISATPSDSPSPTLPRPIRIVMAGR